MATFGQTSIAGYSLTDFFYNRIRANNKVYSPLSDGVATSISLYCSQKSIHTGNLCFALYDSSDSSLVAKTEEIPITTDEGWHTANFTSTVNIYSSKNYYICSWYAPIFINMRYTINEEDSRHQINIYDADYPATISPWTQLAIPSKFAIYCTYTPNGKFSISQVESHEKVYLSLSSDGCNNDFSQFPASGSNYDKIDDPRNVPDADATYVYSDVSATAYDLFLLEDTSITSGTINYVKVFSRAKSYELAQHEDGLYKIIVTDDACSNIYKSSDINLTTGYTIYNNIWTENPRTDAVWTWDNINNLQIGAECDSPLVANKERYLTLRPTANGTATAYGSWGDCIGCDSCSHWMCVDDITPDDYTTYLFQPSGDADASEVFIVPNHTTESGVIASVTVYNKVCGSSESGCISYWPVVYTHATAYESLYSACGTTFSYISHTWITNPNTGAAWTWAEIDAMEIGCHVNGIGGKCTQVYAVVTYYDATDIPEIRTTQMYAMVDYDWTANCVLTKPNEISTNHSRNIKMLNFWNGEREVYDLERSGKSMILKGVEWEDACTTIQCMRDMGLNGSDITLSNLTPDCFNGTYKIVSFGWKQVSKTPEVFEWILQLEDCNL